MDFSIIAFASRLKGTCYVLYQMPLTIMEAKFLQIEKEKCVKMVVIDHQK